MSEQRSQDLHVLGKISGYYGVKGWVKIYSYTQPRENIIRYKTLQVKLAKAHEWQNIQLDNGKAHGKGVVAHFTGYDNREIVAGLIGAELAVQRSEFKPSAQDEYYWTDLVGLIVTNLDGVELGKVGSLIETAANDVLVIKVNASENKVSDNNEILIPFVQGHYVIKVELDAGTMTVDWPVDWIESSKSK